MRNKKYLKMKTLNILFGLLIALISCNNKPLELNHERKNTKIIIQKMPENLPNFRYLRRDDSLNAASIITERIILNLKTKSLDFSDFGTGVLTNCDCKLSSGELNILISNNSGWLVRELNIIISDSTSVTHNFADDITNEIISPQYIYLELNDLTPSISDTIYGRIISVYDTILKQVKLKNDTAKVDLKIEEKYFGHFRCKVK